MGFFIFTCLLPKWNHDHSSVFTSCKIQMLKLLVAFTDSDQQNNGTSSWMHVYHFPTLRETSSWNATLQMIDGSERKHQTSWTVRTRALPEETTTGFWAGEKDRMWRETAAASLSGTSKPSKTVPEVLQHHTTSQRTVSQGPLGFEGWISWSVRFWQWSKTESEM